MEMNSQRLMVWAGALAVIALAIVAGACSVQAEKAPAQAASPLERGKYLTESVGTCYDCHSPRLPTGEPDKARWLQGAPLGFAPVQPVPGWVGAAPAIAGMPAGWSEEQLVTFLETGQKPGGALAGPPMPVFRFNHEDAEAVAAYLRTLPPAPVK
jgi:mono/diheme cytochrome c family protein